MTVLSEENASGESSGTPPRKRFCLSLSGRGMLVRGPATNPPSDVKPRQVDRAVRIKDDHQGGGFSSVQRPRTIDYMTNPLEAGSMLNGDGHGKGSSPQDHSPGSDGCCPPVATLCNLGNTCFLNSVLYTLRFAPAFLHNLHHLVSDLGEVAQHSQQVKLKSSSLGRSIGSSSSKSWSNKDLPALGHSADGKDRIQVATERLHELYEALRVSEAKEGGEPFQPDVFLHALRDVNPIFEGNQQHDAHELLVCLLDNIRETCRLLASQAQASRALSAAANSLLDADTTSQLSGKAWGVRRSWKLKPRGRNATANAIPVPVSNGLPHHLSGIAENELGPSEGRNRVLGHNFVSADFEGVTVLRTTCLECEHVTERKETFCDICVPISTETLEQGSASDLYCSALVTSELLRDGNKYWCEQCLRYNEARRSVRYERLPRLLVLHLKRFSSTFGSMVCVSKVNDFMPTPLNLSCFCERCLDDRPDQMHHRYRLYGVIMHLGATIASGHYVAYVRASESHSEYLRCERGAEGAPRPQVVEKTGGLFKFFRPRSGVGGAQEGGDTPRACRGSDCCGVRFQPRVEGEAEGGDSVWLECDDDSVRVLSRRQLEEVLGPRPAKSSALTPYLLFYSRCS